MTREPDSLQGTRAPGPGSSKPRYYAEQDADGLPDLDAGAPQLHVVQASRLDRKALLFLCGIVLVLIVAAAGMFLRATSDDSPRAPAREERVVVPSQPTHAMPSTVTPIAPVDLQSDPPPPLPIPVVEASPPLPMQPGADPYPAAPRVPTLAERRMLNGASDASRGGEAASPQDAYIQAMLASMGGNRPAEPAPTGRSSRLSRAQFTDRPGARLLRGTYLRCALETRIITDVPGFTSCVLTEPVYSTNGRNLLLPAGSKIVGRYDHGDGYGARVAVVWDRITTPTGVELRMASPGVDGLGGAGHPGDYNAHWGTRIASALLISLIGDAFNYAAAENGPRTTTISNGNVIQTPFESGTARTMERLASQVLERSAARPPTVTLPQGTIVNVYVSDDVDFSDVLED